MGPVQMAELGLAQRVHFRKEGRGFFEIRKLMKNFNTTVVAKAVAQASPEVQTAYAETVAVESEGIMHKIVAAIKKFLASDFGKALMSILGTLLLSLI